MRLFLGIVSGISLIVLFLVNPVLFAFLFKALFGYHWLAALSSFMIGLLLMVWVLYELPTEDPHTCVGKKTEKETIEKDQLLARNAGKIFSASFGIMAVLVILIYLI